MSLACRLCDQPLFPDPLLCQHHMPAAAQELPTAATLSADGGVSLALHQCSACGVVQLTNPPVPYYRDVIRAAGLSAEMRAFRLQQFGAWVAGHDLAGKPVLEVGCGQGEYLALLREAGVDAWGLEHRAASVAHCQTQGLQVLQGFMESPETRFAGPGVPGHFDGFAILNFLEHIPAAHRTLAGIAAHLSPGATGLVEVPNFDMILKAGLFAEFIPDHLHYFTQATLTGLLERSGFEVLECRPEWHDYVLSATVRKRQPLDLSSLNQRQHALADEFRRFLAGFAPGRVAIWGAGHQALALISLMGIAPHIRYVLDSAPFKQGRYTPATHLPIVPPERLAEGEVDAVIVLAASYSDEVLRTLRARHGSRFRTAALRGEHLVCDPEPQP